VEAHLASVLVLLLYLQIGLKSSSSSSNSSVSSKKAGIQCSSCCNTLLKPDAHY
jgi:hypothetical protein